jgi:hypothetical protein
VAFVASPLGKGEATHACTRSIYAPFKLATRQHFYAPAHLIQNFSCSFLDDFRVNGLSEYFAITMKLLGRILLAFSAILLAIGAWIHTSAFGKVSAAVAKSDLEPFLGKGLKVLWLQDSTIMIVLAIVFATAVIRPLAASKTVIVLLGLVPMVTATLVYFFIGNFIAGHIFLTAGVVAILGGFLYPASKRL